MLGKLDLAYKWPGEGTSFSIAMEAGFLQFLQAFIERARSQRTLHRTNLSLTRGRVTTYTAKCYRPHKATGIIFMDRLLRRSVL